MVNWSWLVQHPDRWVTDRVARVNNDDSPPTQVGRRAPVRVEEALYFKVSWVVTSTADPSSRVTLSTSFPADRPVVFRLKTYCCAALSQRKASPTFAPAALVAGMAVAPSVLEGSLVDTCAWSDFPLASS